MAITLESLSALATAVQTTAEAFNAAVTAAIEAGIVVDARVNYTAGTPGAMTSNKISGITATASLQLPIVV